MITKFEYEGNIMPQQHCSVFLLSILGPQTLLHTHTDKHKNLHTAYIWVFSPILEQGKVAGTPAVQPSEHWHGISQTIKAGLKEPVQERYFLLGVFQMTVLYVCFVVVQNYKWQWK